MAIKPIRIGSNVTQENAPDSLPLQAFTVRSGLLDSLQAQLIPGVVPALDRALGRVDDYLFDRSQSGDDALGLTALRDLRQVRGQILKRFEQSLLVGFRALREAQPESAEVFSRALSLLSEEGLEEQLATEQLAESLTRLHAPALEVLGLRVAKLLGLGELAPAANPFAPPFLATALGNAMEGMPLDAAVRIVVFKFFERELGPLLATCYERSNAQLVNAGGKVLVDEREGVYEGVAHLLRLGHRRIAMINGVVTTKLPRKACCWVIDSDETNRPTPRSRGARS